MLLPMRQFIAWHVHNNLMSVEEGQRHWDDELARGAYGEIINGEQTLAVALPVAISREDVMSKRRKLTHEAPVGKENQAAAQMELEKQVEDTFFSPGVGSALGTRAVEPASVIRPSNFMAPTQPATPSKLKSGLPPFRSPISSASGSGSVKSESLASAKSSLSAEQIASLAKVGIV